MRPKAVLLLLFVAAAAGAQSRHRAVRHPVEGPQTAPQASADSYRTPEGMVLTIAAPGVLGNDTLNEASIVSYGSGTGKEQTTIGSITPTAQGGSVTLSAGGGFVYTPLVGFRGIDTFKYVLSNSAGSSTATVTITVTAPAPLAVSDAYNTPENRPLSISSPGVLANDTLNGALVASYGALTGLEQTSIGTGTPTGRGGTVALNGDGSFTYTPATNFTGADSFQYVLTNGAGSSTASVNINVSVPLPVASADSYSTPQNTALNVGAPGVLANDVLNGAQIVSYGASSGAEQGTIGTSTATAQGGTVSLNTDGSFSYSPASGFSGSDSFKYVIRSSAGSSSATVTISVQSQTIYTVTSPGFFYSFSGVPGQNPVLTLKRGQTYTFQVNASSIHPFEILNAPPGSVTNNNISNGTITFAVPLTAQNYAYQCSIHGFGNTIQTVP